MGNPQPHTKKLAIPKNNYDNFLRRGRTCGAIIEYIIRRRNGRGHTWTTTAGFFAGGVALVAALLLAPVLAIGLVTGTGLAQTPMGDMPGEIRATMTAMPTASQTARSRRALPQRQVRRQP